jgi:hypothetical protein
MEGYPIEVMACFKIDSATVEGVEKAIDEWLEKVAERSNLIDKSSASTKIGVMKSMILMLANEVAYLKSRKGN